MNRSKLADKDLEDALREARQNDSESITIWKYCNSCLSMEWFIELCIENMMEWVCKNCVAKEIRQSPTAQLRLVRRPRG